MRTSVSESTQTNPFVSEVSFELMRHTGLKGETEGLITAAQDQALNTRYYSKHLIKWGTTDRCRMCHTQPETVEHIISGWQTLATDQYLNRHNQVAAQLHQNICKHYGIKVQADCSYKHKPEWVMQNEKATILWNSPIITNRHVPCNKPDIVIQEKKADRCQIIDVAIQSDYNIEKKATEKMSKYVDLQIEWPENMEQEGRGHTSHHRCNWNSKQEHQEVCWKNTRLP